MEVLGTGAAAEEQPEGPSPPALAVSPQAGGTVRCQRVLPEPALPRSCPPSHRGVETPSRGRNLLSGVTPLAHRSHAEPVPTSTTTSSSDTVWRCPRMVGGTLSPLCLQAGTPEPSAPAGMLRPAGSGHACSRPESGRVLGLLLP